MIVWFAAAIPEDSSGGVNRNILGFAQQFHRQGISVRRIYSSNKWNNNYLGFGIDVAVRFLFSAPRFPDCIVARSTDSFFCACIRSVFRIRTKIVLHNHGWEERVYELEKNTAPSHHRRLTTWKSAAFRYPLLRATLRLCDFCVCGTLDDIRWLKRRYPSEQNKIRYVPNGVDIPAQPAWLSSAPRPDNFLFVGQDSWRKNIDYALTLFVELKERISGAQFTVVGTGSSTLQRYPAFCQLGSCITHVPRESLEGMFHWYRTCPYLIFTSRYEGGHPLTVLEAMAQGMVVFSVSVGAVDELIHNRVNGVLLDGGDEHGDAGRIAGVIDNEGLVCRISRTAHSTAGRNRWERQAYRYKRIIYG
jgi:glycosyltransferase involved in cell wall biosynthesis